MNKKMMFLLMTLSLALSIPLAMQAEEPKALSDQDYINLRDKFETVISEYLMQLEDASLRYNFQKWAHAYVDVFFGGKNVQEAMKQSDLYLLDIVHSYAKDGREAELAPKFNDFLSKLIKQLQEDDSPGFAEFIKFFKEQLTKLEQNGIREIFSHQNIYDEYKKTISTK